jgi:enediyne biosynthesis protein E4
MRRLVLAAMLAWSAVSAFAEPPAARFVAETDAGVTTAYMGEYLYMVGGGIAVFDCSGDAFPDLYVAGGEAPGALYRNASEPGKSLRFERDDAAGLEAADVLGAYPLDIDSDGILDLVLLRQGANRLMRGLGDCRFEDASAAWGFDGGAAWSAAFAATWEAGQDWPTLAIGNYIDPKEEAFPWGSCTENWLHRPAPAGTGFAPPLALQPSFCALSMLFTDWDNSGQTALRVSNDREYYKGGQEQLWHLPADADPALYTEAEGWQRLRIWGMGIAQAHLDADGLPEYFLTSMADNKLQVLKPAAEGAPLLPRYADIALKRGVTAHRPYTGDDLRPSTGWHAEFGDVNNDGLADLFVVKGNVARMPDFAAADPNNLLIQNADGSFTEAGLSAGVASMGVGRGGALVDLNLDGRLDMVATRRWETPEIWRNATEGGTWVLLDLDQPGVNRDAVGARIEVRTSDGAMILRDVLVGGGHASGQAGFVHVGLGEAREAEVRVRWPDGTWSPSETLRAGAIWRLAPDGAADERPLP